MKKVNVSFVVDGFMFNEQMSILGALRIAFLAAQKGNEISNFTIKNKD